MAGTPFHVLSCDAQPLPRAFVYLDVVLCGMGVCRNGPYRVPLIQAVTILLSLLVFVDGYPCPAVCSDNRKSCVAEPRR